MRKKAKLKEHKTFSSSYNFWYKKERESMFKNLSLVEVDKFDSFIPKIGNSIEKNIFKKYLQKIEKIQLVHTLTLDYLKIQQLFI